MGFSIAGLDFTDNAEPEGVYVAQHHDLQHEQIAELLAGAARRNMRLRIATFIDGMDVFLEPDVDKERRELREANDACRDAMSDYRGGKVSAAVADEARFRWRAARTLYRASLS